MIELLKQLFSKFPKVVILGFGKEGRSTYRLIRRYFPNLSLAIADSNTEIVNDSILTDDLSLETIVGDNYLSCLINFDLIIKSPGVKIENPTLELVNKITSQTDLFLQYYSNQTIGVTGTKGKSTTASLIKHFLDAANKKSLLLGNIGVPAFDRIDDIDDDTIIVYELSAHQLEYNHNSPHIAVLLNVFHEHLDYFNSFESYTNAKFNICSYQNEGDRLIIHNSLVSDYERRKLLFDNKTNNGDSVIVVSDNILKFSFKHSPLIGKHNAVNINFALLSVNEVNVDINTAINSLDSFKALNHRLEHIGEFKGIKYVNDSISTVPESTIAAVKALNNIDTLILGGYDRGLDYSGMVKFLIKSDISNFIFLGKAGDRIYDMFNLINKEKKLIKASSLESIFSIINDITREGSICLLSPAAASYDQFHNFEHRGDVFRMLSQKL